MSEDALKPGDTVRLNSGGPVLTIETITGGKCKCTWFDDKNKLQAETFTVALLSKENWE